MDTYTTRYLNDNLRCQWVYDRDYRTFGSYAYDTEDETKEAEQEEIERINNGELVPLGCIAERFATSCVHCDRGAEWVEVDSCFGIVMETGDNATLDDYARNCMVLDHKKG